MQSMHPVPDLPPDEAKPNRTDAGDATDCAVQSADLLTDTDCEGDTLLDNIGEALDGAAKAVVHLLSDLS